MKTQVLSEKCNAKQEPPQNRKKKKMKKHKTSPHSIMKPSLLGEGPANDLCYNLQICTLLLFQFSGDIHTDMVWCKNENDLFPESFSIHTIRPWRNTH